MKTVLLSALAGLILSPPVLLVSALVDFRSFF